MSYLPRNRKLRISRGSIFIAVTAILNRPFFSTGPRLQSMSTNNDTNDDMNGVWTGCMNFTGLSLEKLPKSHVFTSCLPPDPKFPSPESSSNAPRSALGPRQVQEALYTFVAPTPSIEPPELLAISRPAFRTLGLSYCEANNITFKNLVAGNPTGIEDQIYPWAQCYGGWQFGQWAGQLGDGRAISLFEVTNPSDGKRYELQLKGAGKTPYSRFADGKAVLRSSIREFVASEYLHSIGIPTTRALTLTLTGDQAVRERLEPCAIVARFAHSWVRFGTFDLLRARGDRKNLRILADYVIKEVLHLPEAPPGTNRFLAMYREIVKRNAITVAHWQAQGFMNGVLNTDNTSIMGLSIDFGPFAFMDGFDPKFTPNHDDELLRYSFENQPTVIWWNLIRLAEGLVALFAVPDPDDPDYLKDGLKEEEHEEVVKIAERLINGFSIEYRETFLNEYKRIMSKKLGLTEHQDGDMDNLFTPCLEIMKRFELDFHHFFRRLSETPLEQIFSSDNEDEQYIVAQKLLPHGQAPPLIGHQTALKELVEFLKLYVQRLAKDGEGTNRQIERMRMMKAVNPKFVPKNWVLDEVIERVEKKGDRKVLEKVMLMVENPFNDTWEGLGEDRDAERWCGDVPKTRQGLQCSCSS